MADEREHRLSGGSVSPLAGKYHRLESRVREIRLHGLAGGGIEQSIPPTPIAERIQAGNDGAARGEYADGLKAVGGLPPRVGWACWSAPASATAADRHVVDHQAACAARFHHRGHARTAGLDHRTARWVATGAGDANAVFCRLALAHGHRQVVAANHHPVHHAAATAQPAGHHAAQVLKHGRRDFIFARTDDLHSSSALLESHRATRNHHEVHTAWCGAGSAHHPARARHGHSRHVQSGSFHHDRRCHSDLLCFRFSSCSLAKGATNSTNSGGDEPDATHTITRSTSWRQNPASHRVTRLTTNFKWSYKDLMVCGDDELDSFRQESACRPIMKSVELGKLGPMSRLIGVRLVRDVLST